MYVLIVYMLITTNSGLVGLKPVTIAGYPTTSECLAESRIQMKNPNVSDILCTWKDGYQNKT